MRLSDVERDMASAMFCGAIIIVALAFLGWVMLHQV